MAEQNTSPGSGSRIDEMVLTRVGEDAVIRPLDGVTMDEVKRYVEAERSRNRRTVVWTGTLLLAVFLFFLVIFLSVGIVVLQQRRATDAALADLRGKSAHQASVLGAVSNRLSVLENVQVDLGRLIGNIESAEITRTRELDGVLADLGKLRDWTESQSASAASNLVQIDTQLRDSHAATRGEMASIRTELERVLGDLKAAPGGGLASPGAPAGTLEGVQDFGAGGAPPATQPDAALEGVALTDAALTAAGVFIQAEEMPAEPDGERRAIEIVNFPNGDRFEGELTNGLMHGWGIYLGRGGDRYDGQFRDGLKDGRGTLVYANGDKYIGEFKVDLRAGRGLLSYANGDRYAGEFANDMPSGKGTLLYANGNKYAGNFFNGWRHGLGILRFANGDIYRGEFREDARTGKGTYVFMDGSQYTGDFVNGRRHGRGRYLYAGGEEYDGDFVEGVRQGTGISVLPNGKTIKGLWEADKLVRRVQD